MIVAGVYIKYPSASHGSVIGRIASAIKDPKVKSERVFNTSPNEVKTWIASHTYFGMNMWRSTNNYGIYIIS